MAQYFLDNPNNLPYVHHKDENKLNNNILNLEWINEKDHSKIHGQGYPRERREIDKKEIDINNLKQFRNSPYFVSKEGEVYNLEKNIHLRKEKSGEYYRVTCNYNLKGKHFFVHRMVWECFMGEIPEGKEINHIDSNPKNNSLNNLELVSHIENCKKAKHKNIKVYSQNINTKEITHYSSLSEASRNVISYRNADKIRRVIEKKEIFKGCYWYYEE